MRRAGDRKLIRRRERRSANSQHSAPTRVVCPWRHSGREHCLYDPNNGLQWTASRVNYCAYRVIREQKVAYNMGKSVPNGNRKLCLLRIICVYKRIVEYSFSRCSS
ncbi:hypothetical protein PoB_004134800 [Plakobranchus ocellatus]|uniref:Uncharacterized protein n=1 Tax=Plakobranchus ocellatus TaxID=259542 RepID=A0AAV4B5G4_9GAST|nr:hypothetical protein PoB_004134800 [Plakobranchus ocellatus]